MALAYAGDRPTLTVDVEGMRNDHGVVQLALFRTADGYPQGVEHAAITRTVDPVAASFVVFADLEPGPWALAVLHDENENGRLDTNMLGVPREGIGASENATRRLGEPRFSDAVFELSSDRRVVVVLRYWM